MRQVFANQLAVVIGVLVLVISMIFALIQSTGALGITQGPPDTQPPIIPHPVIGYLDCRSCHDLDGIVPFPPDHADYANAVCTGCHIPSGAETFPEREGGDSNQGILDQAALVNHVMEWSEPD